MYFFFQAEAGIRAPLVTGVQTCALPIYAGRAGGRSVWYRWTAAASGPAMVHAGGFDCLVAVYTGAAVDALTPVAADTGTWAGGSCTARFTAAAGQTYRIAVDGEA